MVVIVLLATTSAAHAYIGPGAGLSALGSALALLGAAFLLIVGFVWYPLKRLITWLKGRSADRVTASPEPPAVMPVISSSDSDAQTPAPHESRPS
jgi:hypothetical protein